MIPLGSFLPCFRRQRGRFAARTLSGNALARWTIVVTYLSPIPVFIANSRPVSGTVLIEPEMSDWVVECHGLCVLHQFAGLEKVSGKSGRRRQGGPSKRR